MTSTLSFWGRLSPAPPSSTITVGTLQRLNVSLVSLVVRGVAWDLGRGDLLAQRGFGSRKSGADRPDSGVSIRGSFGGGVT